MKGLTILALILVFLVVLFLVVKPKESNSTSEFFPDFDFDSANYLKVVFQGETTELVKQNGNWFIKGTKHKADNEAVTRGLETISSLKAGDVISRKPEKYEIFDVKDNQFEIEIGNSSGNKINLIPGKNGPSYMTSYVRLKDKKEVYLVGNYIRPLFQRNKSTGWRDTVIFSFDRNSINSVTVEAEELEITIVKNKEGNWILPEQEEITIDQNKVSQFIGRLASLRAEGFNDEITPEEAALNPALRRISLKSEDSEYILLTGNEVSPDRIFVKTAKDATIYLKYKAQIDSLFKDAENIVSKKEE